MDTGWIVSLSLASIIATVGILSIMNIIVKRKTKKLTKFM